MQEKSLYEKIKTVIDHLYKSIISDEKELKAQIIKRRIDFIRNEIILLGEDLQKSENELTFYQNSSNKELNKIADEFDEFKE